MEIFNALDLKNGAKTKKNKMGTLTQPVQFLPEKEKDDQWRAWNMDWLEMQGMIQLRRNARRLLKNYKLRKGIIDKSDYIIEQENEVGDLIDMLTRENDSPLELKFYPIIPNIINTLVNEFSKRTSKIQFRAVDELSYNEMLEQKRQMIEDTLLQDAEQKMYMKIVAAGGDPGDDQNKQQLSPDNLKTLPEIEQFFKKDYRGIGEIWAAHQYEVDTQRFNMAEMEKVGFEDSLITDREFWHFRMLENDYELENWNPLLTFYHKSPSVRYTSNGNYVGLIDLYTPADVVDKYGYMMTEEQLASIENIYPIRAAGYLMDGVQNDGGFYDATKSHDWNVKGSSLGMRQFTSSYMQNLKHTGDIVQYILSDSEDMADFQTYNLLRVSTIYWKTQRKVGHLTKITDDGEVIQDIVGESYKITDKPLYNTTVYKVKSKDNLIFGEHIDWIWINETWGGIKIGPNRPTYPGNTDANGLDPIYLGISGNKIGRLPFQFKGDNNLYGCKLPVEGCVFNDRNTKSIALVDLLKPSQVGYNMCNNQIADICIDELGTIIMLDQNALPRQSLGEDWGKGNYAKAYVAMKNFQVLPLDTQISNTENGLHFQHYQQLDLEQSKRLLGRVSLAKFFKDQAYELVLGNAQRTNEELSEMTATGVEESKEQSFAQTEMYFTQHSDHLMPRVHTMRTDLAQYYQSNNPSIRLQYSTSEDERVNFQMNGTKLLLRDINTFCTTNINSRKIMEQLRSLALNNNTSGATIFDLGNILKADTIAEITEVLKSVEEKQQQQKLDEQQHEQQLQQQQEEAQAQQLQAQQQFEAQQNDLNRQNKVVVAEIMASAGGTQQDLNSNGQSDYLDSLEQIQKQQAYQDEMDLKREAQNDKRSMHADNVQLTREKIAAEDRRARAEVNVARINKNKYDKPAPKKK
jgi:hypothetical protein